MMLLKSVAEVHSVAGAFDAMKNTLTVA